MLARKRRLEFRRIARRVGYRRSLIQGAPTTCTRTIPCHGRATRRAMRRKFYSPLIHPTAQFLKFTFVSTLFTTLYYVIRAITLYFLSVPASIRSHYVKLNIKFSIIYLFSIDKIIYQW